MNKHGGIGVRAIDGDLTVCASADGTGANYDTLCGNSLSDSEMTYYPIRDSERITCPRCYGVWLAARGFKASNFANAAKTGEQS